MKIVTYNILAECMLEWFRTIDMNNFTRKRRTPMIISKLLDQDVICLQEVDKMAYEDIKNALGDDFVSDFIIHPCNRFGLAMFIRQNMRDKPNCCSHRIKVDRQRIIKFSENTFSDNSRRKYQVGYIGGFGIVNCHLSYNERKKQLERILDDNIDIICGDFNSDHLTIPGFYTSNTEYTNIDDFGELKCIDYIFCKLSSIKCYTNGTPTLDGTEPSDHIPVYGEF